MSNIKTACVSLEDAMRRIGFIDRHLNNFHSNLYVKLIREGKHKDEFDVVLAYGDAQLDGTDTAGWCRQHGVRAAESVQQVVDGCDNLIILSPDNPERHWDLSKYALGSGKACYIDKTFAPDYATAKKLIDLAEYNHTPMFSTSALRFAPELNRYLETVGKDRKTKAVVARGHGAVANYSVHCVEPLVMLLGHGAKSVTFGGSKDCCFFSLAYRDDRIGMFNIYPAIGSVGETWYGHPFEASVQFEGGSAALRYTCDAVFGDLINSICRFFLGDEAPAPFEDTLEIMAILDATGRALESPGTAAAVEIGGLVCPGR